MMKTIKKGAVRKAIVLAMMTVFMAGGVLTAYAEEQENGNTLTEYVIPADQVNHDNVVIMEDDGIACYTMDSITWHIPAGKKYVTSWFRVKKGVGIAVNMGVEPKGVTVWVGVEYPDGSEHYVLADGQACHVFTADSTGDYRIFVENISDVQVSVTGFYGF